MAIRTHSGGLRRRVCRHSSSCMILAFATLAACNREKAANAAAETAAVPGDQPSVATEPIADFKSIANRVVGQSAGVKEGDIVFLDGRDEDIPLLEDMAVEIRKRGGYPLISVGTLSLARRMYDEVPAKYDSQTPRLGLKLAEVFDVFISTESGEGRTLKGIPPERLAARAAAFQPVGALMQKRGVRMVSLGNGLYPSAERAEQFGMRREDLAKMMYSGIDADYAGLQTAGESLRKTLAAGKQLHVTSPSGTDLTLSIKGRPVLVSDGIISPEDRKKGGAATSVWLPAGEVYVTPVPGTAEGAVVADHLFYNGQRIDGLKLEIKGGRVVSMSAKSGLEPLQAYYDKAGRGKDVVGVVDLGINPSIQLPEGAAVNVWSRAGAVTVAVGDNTWAGGENRVNFSVSPEVPAATVTVDGTVLVKDGKLVAAATMANR
jgi:aminopeptidase